LCRLPARVRGSAGIGHNLPMTSLSQNPDLDPKEVAARLLITPTALEELTLDDAILVVNYMQPRRIADGTVLMREGEDVHNDFMLLVLEGEVSVASEVNGVDEDIVVSVLGAGALIGEMGLLDGTPRSATCTADGDVVTAILTRPNMLALMREEPRVAARLLLAMTKRLADRLRETNRKVKALAQINRTLRQELNLVMNNRTPPLPRQ
jgi:CRP/FNR family transcriptional regulator, cyclic AMP receptor protein